MIKNYKGLNVVINFWLYNSLVMCDSDKSLLGQDVQSVHSIWSLIHKIMFIVLFIALSHK